MYKGKKCNSHFIVWILYAFVAILLYGKKALNILMCIAWKTWTLHLFSWRNCVFSIFHFAIIIIIIFIVIILSISIKVIKIKTNYRTLNKLKTRAQENIRLLFRSLHCACCKCMQARNFRNENILFLLVSFYFCCLAIPSKKTGKSRKRNNNKQPAIEKNKKNS